MSLLDTFDSFLAWLSFSVGQSIDYYVDLETAESSECLVAHDGSLVTVIEIHGCKTLMGAPEFERLHEGLTVSLQTAMSNPGHSLQMVFNYDGDRVKKLLDDILTPAKTTAKRLALDLSDLFRERVNFISQYCAEESVYLVVWTKPSYLVGEQSKRAIREKARYLRENKVPIFKKTQNFIATIPELREAHGSFVRSLVNDFHSLDVHVSTLEVHDAVYHMRRLADPDFTDVNWRPKLPGDKMTGAKQYEDFPKDYSDLLWPPLARQIIPRDAESLDLRTCRIGDKCYSSVFIDLFPKDIRSFSSLFHRTLQTNIPWRVSFLIDSSAVNTIKFKSMLATILSFASSHNRLISDSAKLLNYINVNTDDAVVRLRVAATTWAPEGNIGLLRLRTAELAKAIQGWGGCDTSEVCGDPFGGIISSMMGVSLRSLATPSVARLSDVVYMLPVTRPSSPWQTGAILFRTPDGKPWPFQPGSTLQTTWIDLVYARPGSGKSVLSNTMNLALCLSGGIQRLPRISVIDIGPSSSGLISLLREAMPQKNKHLVAYHRLRMTPDYSINPFDTQLGCRRPTAQERSFLVNFVTLLVTPLGARYPYDGMADLAGMVVDELYKVFHDEGKPAVYAVGTEPLVDGLLEEIGFVRDSRTTWWEVTDALFIAGFIHEATLAQRYAAPLMADAASICRISAIEDLYGKITAPTGESLINAFGRMISSAIREYPILSRPTCFDLGEARIVSLDLDEVAKSGGDAADRQTAVMYMLARYIMARHYYLTEDNVTEMPEQYQGYHRERILELREDPKRLVYDEFHRTAKAQAVRDQVVIDMREGRKWKVQIALLSQSVDDFDAVMIEFATAIYIMDAGSGQTVEKTVNIFGLSETAKVALRTRVHGPREGGATFLAQFATKHGLNTQLLTCTLGPIELWAFSTTVEDANIRNKLYKRIGPKEARRVLAILFPGGSIAKVVEKRLDAIREEGGGLIKEDVAGSVVDEILSEIIEEYTKDPDFKALPSLER